MIELLFQWTLLMVMTECSSSNHLEKIDDKNIKEEQTSNNVERKNNTTNSLHDEKKIPRNKACPCGSKKKYKSCCGKAARKLSTVAV